MVLKETIQKANAHLKLIKLVFDKSGDNTPKICWLVRAN